MRTCLENKIPKEKLKHESSQVSHRAGVSVWTVNSFFFRELTQKEKKRLPYTRLQTPVEAEGSISQVGIAAGSFRELYTPKACNNSETKEPRKAEAKKPVDTKHLSVIGTYS